MKNKIGIKITIVVLVDIILMCIIGYIVFGKINKVEKFYGINFSDEITAVDENGKKYIINDLKKIELFYLLYNIYNGKKVPYIDLFDIDPLLDIKTKQGNLSISLDQNILIKIQYPTKDTEGRICGSTSIKELKNFIKKRNYWIVIYFLLLILAGMYLGLAYIYCYIKSKKSVEGYNSKIQVNNYRRKWFGFSTIPFYGAFVSMFFINWNVIPVFIVGIGFIFSVISYILLKSKINIWVTKAGIILDNGIFVPKELVTYEIYKDAIIWKDGKEFIRILDNDSNFEESTVFLKEHYNIHFAVENVL